MLNQNRVLNYIKQNLAFPFQFIELDDNQILEYIKTYSLREFSYYIPNIATTGLNLQLPTNLVPGKVNEYYVTDELGLEILNIKNIYFSQSNFVFHGHPPLGPLSLGELVPWALSVEVAGWVKTFSNWNYTFEFKSPNMVRISPTPVSEQWVTVEYERIHPDSFGTIPNDLQMFFMEFCLADIQILVGRLRQKYGSGGGIKTPFGDIPLNADETMNEGKEKKRELIDKLNAGLIPNCVISFG